MDETTGDPIPQFDLAYSLGLLDEIDGSIMWQYREHSDRDGHFEIRRVGPGDITLFARAEGYAQAVIPVPDPQ